MKIAYAFRTHKEVGKCSTQRPLGIRIPEKGGVGGGGTLHDGRARNCSGDVTLVYFFIDFVVPFCSSINE